MEIINILNPDNELFTKAAVTGWVNKQPFLPEYLAKWLKWNVEGLTLRTALIEYQHGSISLIPQAPVGAPGYSLDDDIRDAISVVVPHFPIRKTLLATEFEGVRAFGSDLLETVEDNLADPMFRLFAIRISSGSDDLRPPALANMWPGETFTIVPPGETCVVIPVGSSTAIFPRTIHAARAITLGFQDVAHSIAGKTVTLSAPATEPVRVFATTEHEVMVTEPWIQSFREADAQYSWQLVTEEVGGIS